MTQSRPRDFMSDFNIRKTANIEKGYLDGRYDSIPFNANQNKHYIFAKIPNTMGKKALVPQKICKYKKKTLFL